MTAPRVGYPYPFMSVQMQLWCIENNRPVRLPSAKLDLEARLEAWLCEDLDLVGEGLLLLGNQVSTPYGQAVDILALDCEGNLAILELKRGKTPRDVVAQILDYASWAQNLSADEIERIAQTYRGRALEDLFKERFRTEIPDSLNEQQRLVIVATQLDPQSERIVQFLSTRGGININVVFLDYYRKDGQEFVGRSWLLAPEEVQRKAALAPSSKKRRLLTWGDLEQIADDKGVGEIYRALHIGLSRLSDEVGTTQSNATYRWRSPSGSRSALISLHPKASGPDRGLIADIRVDDLARETKILPADLRASLPESQPGRQVPGLYLYGEGYRFRTLADVERFLKRLSTESASQEF